MFYKKKKDLQTVMNLDYCVLPSPGRKLVHSTSEVDMDVVITQRIKIGYLLSFLVLLTVIKFLCFTIDEFNNVRLKAKVDI